MREEQKIHLGVCPYADGSGFAAEAIVTEGSVEIEVSGSSVSISVDEWNELTRAVDRAINAISFIKTGELPA